MVSARTERYLEVSEKVVDHIENYTVPQYGDFPGDFLSKMSEEVIRANILRYGLRSGKNARGKTEELRDCLKLIHYASELYMRVQERDDD